MTDRLSDEELVRLDELAGDATPGRWSCFELPQPVGGSDATLHAEGGPVDTVWTTGLPPEIGGLGRFPDAKFIAAADPDVVRALVAEVLESRRIISEVRAILDDEPECPEHPDDDPVTCGWKRDIQTIRHIIDTVPADALREHDAEVWDEVADTIDACIEAGDRAACAGFVPCETGRQEAIDSRDSIYEEPSEWVRAHNPYKEAETALPGTATPAGSDNANEPQTFAAPQRAQGPRRWHVLRSPDDELDLIGASKPWGVFVDDADSQFDDILFVAAFRTHAAAIKFVDRQARS
jgi:hypothetical protein